MTLDQALLIAAEPDDDRRALVTREEWEQVAMVLATELLRYLENQDEEGEWT